MWRFLLIVSLAAIALAACGNTNRKLAFTTTSESEISVHFKPCNEGDALVTRLKLVQVKGNIYGDADDPVLWEVESSTGTRQESFAIGVLPDGFTEKIALTEPPLRAVRLGLLVYSPTKRSAAASFRLADLRSDFVFSNGDYLPEEVFFKKYTCW